MMPNTEHTFTIIDRRGSPWVGWFRTIVLIAAVMAPGVLLDSTAMQWLGFLIVIATGLSVVANGVIKTPRGLTIDEARKHLDELEAKL